MPCGCLIMMAVLDNLKFCCCPVKLSRALYGENVIEQNHLDRVLGCSTVDERRQEVQTQMSVIIGSHPNMQLKPLRTFGTLLMRFDDFTNGRRLLQFACDHFNPYSRLESDGNFALRGIESHNDMVDKVVESLSKFDLSYIIDAYEAYNPELCYEITQACRCSADAASTICERLSLLNLFYVEQVSQKFNLQGIIEEHSQTTLPAFYRLPLNDVLGLCLMPNYKQELLVCEELCIRVEWDSSEKTCNDVKTLLQVSFPGIHCYVMPYQIVNVTYDLVVIRCYAPPHLHGALCRSAKDNQEKLTDMDTLSVSIGDAFVWRRDKKVESQFNAYERKIESMEASLKHKEADMKLKDMHIKDLMETNLSLKCQHNKPLSRLEEKMRNNMKLEIDFLNDKCRKLTDENEVLKEKVMEKGDDSGNQETQRFSSVAINRDCMMVSNVTYTDIYARFKHEIDREINRRVIEHTSSIFAEACDVCDNNSK